MSAGDRCECGHAHTNGPACPKYGCACVSVSAGDRDTLAGIIADEIMKMPYAHRDTVDPLAAVLADVLLASDWLREHDRATYAHGYHHGYKDAAYDHDAAVYGDQDEYLIDRAERAAANEYRTTEATDE